MNNASESVKEKMMHFKQKSVADLTTSTKYGSSEAVVENGKAVTPKVYFKIENTLRGINDLEQTFSVDLILYSVWEVRNGNYDKTKEKVCKMTRTAPDWTPILDFEHILSEQITHESYNFYGDEEMKNGVYFSKLNYLLTISEPLELERFPFDRQILTICLSSANCRLLRFSQMEHLTTGPHRVPKTFLTPQLVAASDVSLAWEYDTWKLVKQHCLMENFVDQTSCVTLTIKMQRCPIFYIYNIGMVMFIIVASAFTIFASDPSNFGNRSFLLFMLLLTAVAFKFVTNSYIPMVSYLTLLDRYILVAFMFLASAIIESFLMSFFMTNASWFKFLNYVDTVYLLIYLGAWVLFNFVIVLATSNDFWGNLFFRMPWGDVVANNNQQEAMQSDFEVEEEHIEAHHNIHAAAIAMQFLHIGQSVSSKDATEYEAILHNVN